MKRLRIAGECLLLAVIVAVSVGIFLYRDRLTDLTAMTYPGIILLCFLANLTVFLPAPSLMVVASFSLVLNPWLVALCGALGSAAGEFSGYLAGAAGADISLRLESLAQRISSRVKRDNLLVFVLALLPLPLFDFAGVYSGSRKMKLWVFAVCCFAGKLLKTIVYSQIYLLLDLLRFFYPGVTLPI